MMAILAKVFLIASLTNVVLMAILAKVFLIASLANVVLIAICTVHTYSISHGCPSGYLSKCTVALVESSPIQYSERVYV